MKKNVIKENINVMRKISNRVPKSINEAINFGMNNEADDMEEPMEEPMEKHMAPKHMEDDGISIENFIANMRKESLGIMKKLADDPDNAVYQFAKKIFQLADKAHEDQKEGKDINGQPKQQMMQQHQDEMM